MAKLATVDRGLRFIARPSWGFMGVEPDDFDIEAAWLRRAQGDLRAFMEALAVRLEEALPQHVDVDSRRDVLLSKTSHGARIEIRTDAAVWAATLAKGVLQATRAKVVRGVVITTAHPPA